MTDNIYLIHNFGHIVVDKKIEKLVEVVLKDESSHKEEGLFYCVVIFQSEFIP